uniref:Uncharacterized protein n=1 Tax=Physcomitrium patens TaxID=3218 RepID=A0A2K1KMA4_PHYPA|nr:hypothetical protein PHYPA_005790 [Physcomitrium patens]
MPPPPPRGSPHNLDDVRALSTPGSGRAVREAGPASIITQRSSSAVRCWLPFGVSSPQKKMTKKKEEDEAKRQSFRVALSHCAYSLRRSHGMG